MFERCECRPPRWSLVVRSLVARSPVARSDPISKTFECGIDKFGKYNEKNIQDQNTITEKNIQDQNMIIGDFGDTSGPVTTVEPPWLREWTPPGPREDYSSSDGEPE